MSVEGLLKMCAENIPDCAKIAEESLPVSVSMERIESQKMIQFSIQVGDSTHPFLTASSVIMDEYTEFADAVIGAAHKLKRKIIDQVCGE